MWIRVVAAALLVSSAPAQSSVAFTRGIVPGQSAPPISGGVVSSNAVSQWQLLAAQKANNIAVSEVQLDGHIDDVFWASKDTQVVFLVGWGVGPQAAALDRVEPLPPLLS